MASWNRSAVPAYSRLAVALFLAARVASPAGAQEPDPVASTLAQIKTSYKVKRIDEAERELRTLAELLAAPEREASRTRALPAYHFYSAAVAWERRDEARAKEDLARFFAFMPTAGIDPGSYPKSYVIFFEAQREIAARTASASAPASGPQHTEGAALNDYATRGFDPALVPAYAGEANWIEGPVRHLLTDKEAKAFKKLQSDEDRREFVRKFWESLDPDMRTSDNEFQTEFYRRLQYADANFSTESTKGSNSDRGMVFLVLGPPSYAGRSPLKRSQDPMQVLRETTTTLVTDPQGRTAMVRVPAGNAPLSVTEVDGEVEAWYYRRDRIPKGIPFTELQYVFITRQGYGTAVLQKEPRELTALRRSARLLRREHAD